MAPAAKETKAAAAKGSKAAPKTKAATTRAAKDNTAATPKKSRKRAADALEEESKPAHIDAPAKQAKKDGARKAKAKAKEEAAAAPDAAAAVEVAAPKAKKAKTTKSTEPAAVKAEDKDAKPAKLTKKKADTDAAKTKKAAATPKSPAKKAAAAADGSEAKPKKTTKAKDAADGAAPKPKKRKASTIEAAEDKAKTVVSNAAKKQKISEETADETQSLLGIVGSTLQGVSKRMSGLFTVLSGNEEGNAPMANGTKKKAAPKKSSAKAKAAPSGEDFTTTTTTGADAQADGALTLGTDSDYSLQDDDPAAAILRGLGESSGDEDGGAASGDGDAGEGLKAGAPVPKLPKRAGLAKKLKAAGAAGEADGERAEGPGVVYIGRIPHGFHEHEMRAYFSQFGTVEHVRLSRSKKTGASKHYAFLQFASAEVARIAAETMNNYLMFGHILKCQVIPPKDVHPRLWAGADRRFKAVPWNKIQGRKLAEPKGRSEWQNKIDAEAKRRATKAKKLKAIGYEFDAPTLTDVSNVPVRPIQTVQQTSKVTKADASQVISADATQIVKSPALLQAEAEAQADEVQGQAVVEEAVKAKGKKGSKKPTKAAA